MILTVSGEPGPSLASLGWAAAAGAVGVGGLGCFFYALSRGTMGMIAPLAALIGAGLPVLLAIVGGESAAPARLVGMALALAAVVLISLPGGERSDRERRARRVDLGELPVVILAGLGFAGFFLFIDRASENGETWWPLLMVRLVGFSLVVLALAFVLIRTSGPWRRRVSSALGLGRLRARRMSAFSLGGLLLLAGAGDLGGNTFFLLASQAGAFSIAVVLSSLYPVVTTILAVVLLRERLRPVQILGVVLATISVPLLH